MAGNAVEQRLNDMGIKPNETYKGKNGKVWLNNKLIGTCTSFSAKVTIKYETYEIGGRTYREAEGYEVSGTIKNIKVNEMYLELLSDAIRANDTVTFNIIGKEANNTTERRVSLEQVTFDDLNLIDFESGKSKTEEMSFQAVDFVPIK